MLKPTRSFATLGVAGVALAALAGCGSDSASSVTSEDQSLDGATLVVSSKDFTENILLGKITETVLAAHGASITDQTNIQGSSNVRKALTSGDVDMYWEYTGTAWINYLGHTDPIADPQEQYDKVVEEDADNDIAWLDATPFNNTYAMAVNADNQAALGVESLSDLAALAKSDPDKATFCVESEFNSRDDGFPGMVDAYDISVPDSNVKLLDTGVIYNEVAKGDTCTFGEVFTTDGRIAALDLTVLTDDKQFFPNYNASLTLRQEILDEYPQIADYMNPVIAKLDDATMTELNSQVDTQGLDPSDVAEDWLTEQDLI